MLKHHTKQSMFGQIILMAKTFGFFEGTTDGLKLLSINRIKESIVLFFEELWKSSTILTMFPYIRG